jgi:phosphatidylglycerophosphatase A
MVAMPLVFFLNPFTNSSTLKGCIILIVGFGLFRFFDIIKPWGI